VNLFLAGVILGFALALVFDHYILPWLAHRVWLRSGPAVRMRRRGA
jgi:hypothetical protein